MKKIKYWVLALAAMLTFSGYSFAHGISEEAKRRMIEGGNFEYFRLGAEHMVTGYDHLLFLFGVVFFLTRFRDILKFVTAFTIGHTITLIFATNFQITANYYLVDAFIAITVIYKGFENLDGFRQWLQTKSPNPVLMVLLFGLVHGFGLSTRLQQLPIAESGNMLSHILSFNAGVEVGQIAALLLMFGLLHFIRKFGHFVPTSKLINGGVIFAGALLLMMQLHGFSHSSYADDFPISRDDHAHAHLEAAQASAAQAQAADESGHGHAHNPDGSHAMPGDAAAAEHGHSHNPDGSHALPADGDAAAHGHAHNPDGSHMLPAPDLTLPSHD